MEEDVVPGAETGARATESVEAGASAVGSAEGHESRPSESAGQGERRTSQSAVETARDRALVERARSGDLDAFNELVGVYQDYLYGVVVRVVGDRESAADAVQEAFFSAYRHLARFQGDVFRSWLTRIALNAATDILRQRKRKPADPFPEWEDEEWQPRTGEEYDPEQEAHRRAKARALSAALLQLSAEQRSAIVLYDVEGFDYQEIADMAGVSLGTVKSRIHRGRLALRELLADQMELFRS